MLADHIVHMHIVHVPFSSWPHDMKQMKMFTAQDAQLSLLATLASGSSDPLLASLELPLELLLSIFSVPSLDRTMSSLVPLKVVCVLP